MKKKKVILFFISLFFLISPYVFLRPLVLVFLVPLIYTLYFSAEKRILYYILLIFIASTITLIPVIFYEWYVYALSVFIATLFLVCFCFLSQYLIRNFKNTRLVVFLPAFSWLSLYYLLNIKCLLTPAFDIGNLLPMTCPLIWFLGSIGITFLILVFNGGLAYFFIKRDKMVLALNIFLLLIFTFCYFYSNFKNPKDFSKEKRPIHLAIIQGNFNYPWEWSRENVPTILKKYKYLTQQAINHKIDLILWPEYTLVVDIVKENSQLRQELKDFIASVKTPFIIGSIIYEEPRPWHQDVSLIFDKNGELLDYYSSLTPALFNMYTLKSKKPLRIFKTPFYSNELTRTADKFGIIVCWEEIDSEIARKYSDLEAEYLISLSNVQDLDKSWLLHFTSYFTRSRAAENKRYLARCTNTGITQIISPTGKIVSRIPSEKEGFLYGTIYSISDKTFYTKYGDILTKVGLIIIFLAMIGVNRALKKNSYSKQA